MFLLQQKVNNIWIKSNFFILGRGDGRRRKIVPHDQKLLYEWLFGELYYLTKEPVTAMLVNEQG